MKTSKIVLKNMFSLSVAEAANKGITFITVAYLARVINPDGFGIIGYAQALTAYFILFVNLGFDTYGMREISRNPSNFGKLVNSILSLRFSLASISYLLLIIVVLILNKPSETKYVIL
ncbi:MAG: hypothetical protein QG635_1064, partial [Bacteroidota bacterium]|nr:hypothetical protein [Bacteroidota bacterium]